MAGSSAVIAGREQYVDGCSFSGGAADVNTAVVLNHQSIDGGQSKSGAFADRASGEERVKHAGLNFRCHAAAFVTDAQKHTRLSGGGEPGFGGSIGSQIASGDFNSAFSIERVAGVEDQVSKDQIELRFIDENVIESLLAVPDELDVFSGSMSQESE